MKKISGMAIGIVVICLCLSPVLANAGQDTSDYLKKLPGKVYKGSVTVLDRTEDVFSGVLKRVFGFFNPCLDLVKGCTNVVMKPIEKPLNYVERMTFGKKPVGPGKIPAPKKPDMPAK